ncbi:MAG: sigma-54 dependent transcriptional regulator [Desulfobacterales bacterium]
MPPPSSAPPAVILAVDDSPDALELIRRHLAPAGYRVLTASNAEEAARRIEEEPVDLVITDMRMPGKSGLDLVRHIRSRFREVGLLMVTGYPSIGGAVEAVRLGAEDYLAKPFTRGELLRSVANALEQRRLRSSAPIPAGPAGLLGASAAMRPIFYAIEKAAAVNATVLITGESGTGKELVARAIHYRSPRAPHPFVPVNCGGIPESLLESELFGHVQGAFTGATVTRAGFFQTGDRGTIFLDEVAEMSLAMQVKLLRVLQEKEITLVGSARPLKVDVRIIAGTNKNLEGLIRAGRFREDLYYRLHVIGIELPPLRARGDDVLLLTHHFTAKYAAEMGRPSPRFTEAALEALRRHPWPGNVRELENLVQRLLALVEGDTVDVADLPAGMRSEGFFDERRLDRPLAEVEREYVQRVLERCGGNKSRAARVLGIDRKTLREKLRAPVGGAKGPGGGTAR